MAEITIESPQRVDRVGRPAPAPGEHLDRVTWMIRLRWWAAAAMAVLVALAMAADVTTEGARLLALVGGLVLANLAFARAASAMNGATPSHAVEDLLALQISVDIGVLLGALHLAGGAENPFVLLSLVLLALAAIVLPLRRAIWIAGAASIVYLALIAGEAAGVLPHYGLRFAVPLALGVDSPTLALWRSPMYVAGLGFAHLGAGLTVLLLVAALVGRIREAERLHREQQAQAAEHERLARIGALVAGVAHTIRNPLQGVMSCVDLLQQGHSRSREASAEILELLAEGVGRIESVTGRLLTLARETPMAPGPTDVYELVQDAMRVCEPKARSREVSLVLACQLPAPLHLWVCPNRLTEAVANVIDNAVDASTAGGEVTIALHPAAEGGVRMEVRDRGCGIADADLPRIFEPFFTTKAVGEGTGLGLAITRQVVEDYGGAMRVVSQPGGGTIVSIALPACHAARPSD
ncbi:MAG: hypothetical protein FJ100_07640 [Deltaproteobacteria bacterium]|nr:hypothetical protein [Deltaproteobacteria bacterium]